MIGKQHENVKLVRVICTNNSQNHYQVHERFSPRNELLHLLTQHSADIKSDENRIRWVSYTQQNEYKYV